jgi:hypothetical protein
VTGTGISSAAFAALTAGAFICAGCAGGARRPQAPTTPVSSGPLAELRARAAPGDWRTVRIPNGAALHYPPRWQHAHGDAGTATVVLLDDRRRIEGYLNVTPRQGGETLANWASFRVSHNVQEGETAVSTEAVARGVRFRDAVGSCVRDRYQTVSRARYIEIACLVQGAASTSVVVAAAPPGAWTSISPSLYRALSAFSA